MNTVKLTGITVASAAAVLFLAGCGGDKAAKVEAAATATAAVAEIKCSGINSCKGTSACATATSACQGQNACKGQGWVKSTKADCDSKGGKVI